MIGCHRGDGIKQGEVKKGGEEERRKGMKGDEETSVIRQQIQE